MLRRRRRTPAEVAPTTYRELTMDESRWRGEQLEGARALVERYCDRSEMPPSVASLDAAVVGWLDDPADDRLEAEQLVDVVGVAFGHQLAKHLRLTWAVAVDATSTSLVVRDGADGLVVVPGQLVADRVVAGERRFLEPALAELSAQLGER